jgi:hypothetical protein
MARFAGRRPVVFGSTPADGGVATVPAPYFEALITRESASLEASHGNADRALELFDAALDSLHRAGNLAHLAVTLADLAACFDGSGQFEIAATIYGTVGHFFVDTSVVTNLPTALEHLHGTLGDSRFDECVAAGAAMELPDAVRYARDHIRRARDELAASRAPPFGPRGR